jgi:hypothetical protein
MPKALIWISGPKLKGRFLPSLRQFVVKPAPRLLTQVALGPKSLYVLDEGGRVWTTAAPGQR